MDPVWNKLRFFRRSENWGNADAMSPALLLELDAWRAYIGVPVMILKGTQGIHEEHSRHYTGEAVDVLVAEPGDMTLLDLWVSALRFRFTAVGVYPHWELNGKPVGGLHLQYGDDRAHRSLWLGVLMGGKQVYIPATEANLRAHGVLR